MAIYEKEYRNGLYGYSNARETWLTGKALHFRQQKSPSSPMGRKTRDSHPISPLRHRIGLSKSKQTLIL